MNETPGLTPQQTAARQRKLARMKKRRRQRMIFRLGCVLCALGAIAVILVVGRKPEPLDEDFPNPNASLENSGPEILRNVQLPDWVDIQLVPINGAGRRGIALEDINDIVIHYVGNPDTTAQQNHDYYAQADTSVSSHFLVGLEGEIIQCVPLNEKSSASNHRNRDTISIEVCHPDATGAFNQISYDSLVKLTAWLCDLCSFDSSHVIRHYDITGKECPLHFVQDQDAWAAFLSDVDAARNT